MSTRNVNASGCSPAGIHVDAGEPSSPASTREVPHLRWSELAPLLTCPEHGDPVNYGCTGCDAAQAQIFIALRLKRVRAVKLRRHLADLVLRYVADDVAHSISPREVSRSLRAMRAGIKLAETA